MKEYFKRQWVIIFILCGCLSFLGYGFFSYQKELKQNYQAIEKICRETPPEILTETEQNYCNHLEQDNLLNPDFYMYIQEIVLTRCKFLFYPLVTTLILFIPTVYGFRFINKNENLRKNIVKKAYQYIWVWPVLIGILLFLCQISAGPVNTELINQMWKYNPILKNHFIYSCCYLLNVLLHSILFINILLIVYRKQQNKTLTLLFAIFLHAVLLVFADLGFSLVFQIIFQSDIGAVFNIGNGFYIYSNTWNIAFTLLASIFWVVSSSIIVYLMYKDKDKLLKDFHIKIE